MAQAELGRGLEGLDRTGRPASNPSIDQPRTNLLSPRGKLAHSPLGPRKVCLSGSRATYSAQAF